MGSRRKAEKEDSVDNYLGNNPLYVNRRSPLSQEKTAFSYEGMIMHERRSLEDPVNAFGSLCDRIIRRCGRDGEGESERKNKEPREDFYVISCERRENFIDS